MNRTGVRRRIGVIGQIREVRADRVFTRRQVIGRVVQVAVAAADPEGRTVEILEPDGDVNRIADIDAFDRTRKDVQLSGGIRSRRRNDEVFRKFIFRRNRSGRNRSIDHIGNRDKVVVRIGTADRVVDRHFIGSDFRTREGGRSLNVNEITGNNPGNRSERCRRKRRSIIGLVRHRRAGHGQLGLRNDDVRRTVPVVEAFALDRHVDRVGPGVGKQRKFARGFAVIRVGDRVRRSRRIGQRDRMSGTVIDALVVGDRNIFDVRDRFANDRQIGGSPVDVLRLGRAVGPCDVEFFHRFAVHDRRRNREVRRAVGGNREGLVTEAGPLAHAVELRHRGHTAEEMNRTGVRRRIGVIGQVREVRADRVFTHRHGRGGIVQIAVAAADPKRRTVKVLEPDGDIERVADFGAFDRVRKRVQLSRRVRSRR